MSMRSERKVPIINQSYMNQQQMQSLQATRKKKLLMRRLTIFFVFAAVVVFLSINAVKSQQEILEAKTGQLMQLQAESKILEEKQNILREEIIKLQDDEYIGKYARQEYFLSNDGEIIFSIPNDEE